MKFLRKLLGAKPHIGILGCGWIGLPLAKELLKQGYTVSASTTRTEKVSVLQNIGLKEVFVGKFAPNWQGEDISKLLEADIVILDFPPGKASEEDFHWQQMQALLKDLDADSKVIYTSSTSIYPELGKEVFESDVETVEQAAHQKIAKAEIYLRAQLKERLTILRCGGLTGWDRNLAKYFSGKTNLEGGSVPVNLVHGEDVVRAIVHLIQQERFGQTYNVVAPLHPNKEDFYTDLCKKSNLALPLFTDIVQDVKFKIVNSDKIQRETGFKFTFENPKEFTYTESVQSQNP